MLGKYRYRILLYFLYRIHIVFARFERRVAYTFARKEKQRTEPKLARFWFVCVSGKQWERVLREPAGGRYERCTCADLVKNISPMQLLRHLHFSSRLSRFSFFSLYYIWFCLVYMYLCCRTYAREFTSERLKRTRVPLWTAVARH